MHRIFEIHDLVVKISTLVEENQDLYSLARANRLVSKAVLDVLWSDITLDKYLYLFRQELAPFGDAQIKVGGHSSQVFKEELNRRGSHRIFQEYPYLFHILKE